MLLEKYFFQKKNIYFKIKQTHHICDSRLAGIFDVY